MNSRLKKTLFSLFKPTKNIFFNFVLTTLVAHISLGSEIKLSENSRIHFSKLTINEGLIDYNTQSFVQDSLGFIWIGGKGGIQRYDGKSVTVFKPEHTTRETKSNIIVTKLYIHNNKLWCSSSYGILCFDIESEKFKKISFAKESINEYIYDIVFYKGKYWISSTNGLFCGQFDEQSSTMILTKVRHNNKSYDTNVMNRIQQLIFISNNNFLGLSNSILGLYTLQNDSLVKSTKRLINDEIGLKTIKFKNNNCYVLSINSITKYSNISNTNPVEASSKTFQIKSSELEAKYNVNEIQFVDELVDNHGSIWVSSNVGLFKIDDNASHKVTLYKKSESNLYSLSSDKLLRLFLDRSNIMWIGTLTGGVCYLDLKPGGVDYFDDENHVLKAYTPIKTIKSFENGQVWLGTDNYGIIIRNSDETTSFLDKKTKHHPISGNNILSIISPSKTSIWVASRSGIDMINLKTMEATPLDCCLINFKVKEFRFQDFCSDKNGNVWITSLPGKLYRVKKKGINNYKSTLVEFDSVSQRKLSFEIFSTEADTVKNELLLGTSFGMYILKLDNSSSVIAVHNYQTYKGVNSLSNNIVQQIVKESDSTYYLSLLNYAINKITINPQYKPFGYKSEVIEEPKGNNELFFKNLVLVQDKLYYFDDAINVYDPKTGTISRGDLRFKWPFDYIIKNSKTFSNRNIYLGTSSGYIRIHPEKWESQFKKMQVNITDFNVNHHKIIPNEIFNGRVILSKSILFTNNVILKHNENNIELAFSDLDYSSSKLRSYHYKLEGFDKVWHNTQRNSISYTNLDPGTYVFKVSNVSNYTTDNKSLIIEIKHSLWVRWYMILLYFVIAITIMIISFYNATRRIQMTNQLEINKEINKLKLQFFTNITHDLKTPLSLIIAPSEELLNEKLAEQTRYKINLINKNATRLLSLVNELLSFRKSEFELYSLSVEYCNPNLFIQELVTCFQEEAIRKDILLHFTPCEAEFTTWIDKESVTKIVSNLISNALKYTHKNGAIGLKIVSNSSTFESMLKTSVFKTQNQFKAKNYFGIIISDTGVGISKESLPHIFERFYQVSEDRSKHLGAGVGLAIVKNLVHQHKGEIIVSSDRDRGTVFLVKLPLGDEFLTPTDKKIESTPVEYLNTIQFDNDSLVVQTDTPRKNKQKKASVLFVEDNEDLRGYLKHSFDDDFVVYDAENGKVGYELALKYLPDVIISDIGMPIMNGIELCSQIKSDIRVSHIPFILLTAKSAENSVVEGFLTGADRYISKPFSIIVLKANIESLLRNNIILKRKFEDGIQSIQHDTEIPTIEKEFLSKLNAVIHEKIGNSAFSIDQLSAEMGMSVRSLQMKLKSMAGISPLEIIRNVRLEKAALLLENSDLRISDIGFEVGFVSAAHFTKCFKDKYGVSPKEYAHR